MNASKTGRRVWLRYPEAAAHVGVSERQLRRATQAGRVPYTRLGNAVLFDPEALDAWVAANTHRPAVSA